MKYKQDVTIKKTGSEIELTFWGINCPFSSQELREIIIEQSGDPDNLQFSQGYNCIYVKTKTVS
jgi:hypothetical protein